MGRSAKPAPSSKARGNKLGHASDRLFTDRRFRQKDNSTPGIAVCSVCQAINYDKHWFIDPAKLKALKKKSNVHNVRCPGCERIERHIHEGEVVLESNLLKADRTSCMGLIKHTEGKAWHDNPMSRIASIVERGNRIEILTTTRWLAARLGKEFHKCYKGKLEIKPSPREKYVRVYWSR